MELCLFYRILLPAVFTQFTHGNKKAVCLFCKKKVQTDQLQKTCGETWEKTSKKNFSI